MVTAEESQMCQQFAAWNSKDLNQMALLQPEKNCGLLYLIPSALDVNLGLPGQPFSNLIGCNTRQPSSVAGNISYPCGNSYPKNLQNGLGVSDNASCAHGKRFLIFDRSGNHTRLFVSPSFSCQNNIISSKAPATARGLCEKVASGVDKQFLVRPVAEEKWDENSLNDDESEMVEDTEDINALLWSDSDDDINDGKNCEVTSMGHTLLGIEDWGNKNKLLEQAIEEVGSSDISPKRQKLLDGNYKKSSLGSAECNVKLAPASNYKDDVLSHDNDSCENEIRVKIREAVEILGSIIPRINCKDPLFTIQKAIDYLETMKMEAKTVGYTTFRSRVSLAL